MSIIFIFIFECNKIFVIKIKTYSVYQIKLINHQKDKKKKPIDIKNRAQNTAHIVIEGRGCQDKFNHVKKAHHQLPNELARTGQML
jgi:hypothetical protein